jgi:hypothetical protein
VACVGNMSIYLVSNGIQQRLITTEGGFLANCEAVFKYKGCLKIGDTTVGSNEELIMAAHYFPELDKSTLTFQPEVELKHDALVLFEAEGNRVQPEFSDSPPPYAEADNSSPCVSDAASFLKMCLYQCDEPRRLKVLTDLLDPLDPQMIQDILDTFENKETKLRAFQRLALENPNLTWQTVEKLCQEYGCSLILPLVIGTGCCVLFKPGGGGILEICLTCTSSQERVEWLSKILDDYPCIDFTWEELLEFVRKIALSSTDIINTLTVLKKNKRLPLLDEDRIEHLVQSWRWLSTAKLQKQASKLLAQGRLRVPYDKKK